MAISHLDRCGETSGPAEPTIEGRKREVRWPTPTSTVAYKKALLAACPLSPLPTPIPPISYPTNSQPPQPLNQNPNQNPKQVSLRAS